MFFQPRQGLSAESGSQVLLRHGEQVAAMLNSLFVYLTVFVLTYSLSETRRLMLQYEKTLSDNDKKQLAEINQSSEYAGIKQTMLQSIEKLLVYTELLDYMDDGKFIYADDIKRVVLSPKSIETILSHIMRSETMPPEVKLGLTSAMFRLASEYLSAESQNDPIYEKLIMDPLQELQNNLTLISLSKHYQQSDNLRQLTKNVKAVAGRSKRGKS